MLLSLKHLKLHISWYLHFTLVSIAWEIRIFPYIIIISLITPKTFNIVYNIYNLILYNYLIESISKFLQYLIMLFVAILFIVLNLGSN